MLDLSKESREQTQIMQDIHTLNNKLNNRQNHFSHQHAHSQIQQKFISFSKFNEIKDSQRMFLNQLNNIEYFSQIGKKDNEEDSLFESGNHFLAANGHSIQKKSSVSIGFSSNQYKNIENQVMSNANIPQKNEQKNLKEDRILQILKEQDYIYRKEKSQGVNNLSKNQRSLFSKQSAQKGQYINTKSPKTKPIKDHHTHNNYLKRDGKDKINGMNSQYNLHNYLMIQNQSLATENNKIKKKAQFRLKTEECKPHFQTLEAYFQQVISNAVGNSELYLNEGQSKSKSKINGRSNYPQKSKSEMECTFKPKILKKSQDMMKNNVNVIERLTAQIAVKKKIPYQPIKNNINKPSMQRIDQLSQPRAIKTLGPQQKEQVPSFRPSLSKKSLSHMSNCTYDVATRNKLWLQQKEEKLNRLRKEEEEQKQKREGGNYSPILQPYRGQQQAQFSKFGKQGMVQYFQRVSLAKKKNSIINIRREQGWNASRDDTEQFMRNNKQNMLNNLNRDKSSSQIKGKKQSYEDAVKQLHNKIMKLRI